jgi:protoporphyrinogen oxidase
VLEKEEVPGGLCRSFSLDGFTYDVGGHILFSRDEGLLSVLTGALGDNLRRGRRNNLVLYKDRLVKYPFENGLGALDKQDIYECLIGYLKNPHPEPTDFEEWVLYTFGDGIAGKYLLPYNEKIWKVPLKSIGLEWVERVPRPPVEDIVKSALGIETEGYTHQLNFYYPVTGGIQSLVQSFARGGQVTCGFAARRIEREKGGWRVTGDTGQKSFERLVIAMPVDEALSMMDGVPDDVKRASDSLVYNSVRLVLVGLDDESLMDKSAIYIPDPSVAPHRVCYMGYFSPENVPSGCSSLVAEVTTRPGHPLHAMPADDFVQQVVDDLDRAGIIDSRRVKTTEGRDIKYAYVVHDKEHRKNVGIIRSYFEELGVSLHGRFGEFEYINMDEVVGRSIALAKKLDSSVPSRE